MPACGWIATFEPGLWFGIWGLEDCGLCRSWCLGFEVLPLLGSCISPLCLHTPHRRLPFDFIHLRYYFLLLVSWVLGETILLVFKVRHSLAPEPWHRSQFKFFSTSGSCAFKCHCGVPKKAYTQAGLSGCFALPHTPYDLE